MSIEIGYGVGNSGNGGGGSQQQVALLSITTAPSGEFAKGSKYYDSTTKKIYTATTADTWTGATESDPQFNVIYTYDNNGTTEYYQWDGDNLVETDLEKYQLKSNITNSFDSSSQTTYPSSKALSDGLDSVKPTLFDIKTMSEQIASKGWSCISYDTQNKLNKADVPTAYDFIETKYKNVDGAMSEPTAISGTIAQVYHDGWYYYISNDSIYRSQYVDLSSPELFYNDIQYNYNRLLMKVEFSNKAYIIAYRYKYPTFYCKVIDLETKQLVKTNNVTVSAGGFDDNTCLSRNSDSIFVVNNIGYMLFTTNVGGLNIQNFEEPKLVLLKIEDDGTVSFIFYKTRPDIFYKGFPNDLTILYSKFKNCCLFNNKIYLSFGGMIWLWIDTTDYTLDYSMDMITNYGQYETYWSYGAYYRNGDSVIFVYDNKLSILACSYDGNTFYFMQLNGDTWTLVNTIDISSQTVEIGTGSSYNFSANIIYDGYYYFAFKLYNQNKWVVYKTSDFSNNNLTPAYDTSYSYTLYLILINENNFSYITYSSGGFDQYIYSGYSRTIYTDTINGTDIKYYKNGDWKICTPDIAVGNDTNLQTVYEYLGYLNYWWIDIANEKIALPRNSNRWTFIYVGDDYNKEVEGLLALPTGISTRLLSQPELIEIDTASITLDILANKVYKFTNSEITDITFSTIEDSNIPTSIKFTTGNSAPTFTDNSGINWVDGTPIFQANKTYQIIIFDNDGYIKEF